MPNDCLAESNGLAYLCLPCPVVLFPADIRKHAARTPEGIIGMPIARHSPPPRSRQQIDLGGIEYSSSVVLSRRDQVSLY